MTDTQLIKKLEDLLLKRCWKFSFNHDREDGFWIEIDKGYSILNNKTVADLNSLKKRKTLREAIIAAIEYLENPPVKRIRI